MSTRLTVPQAEACVAVRNRMLYLVVKAMRGFSPNTETRMSLWVASWAFIWLEALFFCCHPEQG